MAKKKRYDELPEQEPMMVNEPAVGYGEDVASAKICGYDIPKEYLLRCIEQSEREIAEGKITTHEEMKRRFKP